jgi:TusA-related sulfurtransferase
MEGHAMSEKNPEVILEMSGLSCPAPLLGAKKVVEDLLPGQCMRLISNCPATADDLFSWAGHTGNTIIGTQSLDGGRTAYTIEKGSGRVKQVGNVVLDMRGVTCPGPILEAKKLLDGMHPGEVLVLISDCPGSRADILTWVENTSVELIDKYEATPNTIEYYLRKTLPST